MTNAFACTRDGYRRLAIEEVYLPQHEIFMRQRIAWAAIRLDGHDGRVYALPQTGNQIGSCEGPILFRVPYRDSLADWRMDTRNLSPVLALETPNGKFSDAGLQVYADDVFERRIVISGLADEALAIIDQAGKCHIILVCMVPLFWMNIIVTKF